MSDSSRLCVGGFIRQERLQSMRAFVVHLGILDRRRPGAVPGSELPSDVAVLFSKLTQSYFIRVYRVQRSEHVDERVGKFRTFA